MQKVYIQKYGDGNPIVYMPEDIGSDYETVYSSPEDLMAGESVAVSPFVSNPEMLAEMEMETLHKPQNKNSKALTALQKDYGMNSDHFWQMYNDLLPYGTPLGAWGLATICNIENQKPNKWYGAGSGYLDRQGWISTMTNPKNKHRYDQILKAKTIEDFWRAFGASGWNALPGYYRGYDQGGKHHNGVAVYFLDPSIGGMIGYGGRIGLDANSVLRLVNEGRKGKFSPIAY